MHIPGGRDTLGGMCRAITCKKCGKPSWAGCGAHVEQVLGNVPKAQRCQCNAPGAATAKPKVSAGTAAQAQPSQNKLMAWLRK